MGRVAGQLLDLTLVDDRLTFHGADGPVEVPLPYQIHARLIQTGELARLLAEHVRATGGDRLPAPGSKVRMLLPLDWGLLCLRLPMAEIEELAQPAHHLHWEVDTNATESAGQYLFDIKPAAGDAGESLLLALRSGLLHFCQCFCEELGWTLERVAVAQDELGEFELTVSRAADWQERLRLERFPRRFTWRPLLYAAALIGVVALALLLPRDGDRPQTDGPDSLEPTPLTAKPDPALEASLADGEQPERAPAEPLDSLHEAKLSAGSLEPAPIPAAVPPASSPVRNGNALLLAWKDLLAQLAAHEDRLPDFLAIDSGGILVRREGPSGLPLADLVGRAARVSRVGSESWWIHFDQPLFPSPPGRRQLGHEDASRPATSFEVGRLGELDAALKAAPARLILQRRRQADAAGAGLQWNLAEAAGAEVGIGWRVKTFPLAGPLGGSGN